MAQVEANGESLKQAVKEALSETLYEQREFLHEVFAEVLEDFALAGAIRDGRDTKLVERGDVLQILQAPS
jgi:hypothetical protein